MLYLFLMHLLVVSAKKHFCGSGCQNKRGFQGIRCVCTLIKVFPYFSRKGALSSEIHLAVFKIWNDTYDCMRWQHWPPLFSFVSHWNARRIYSLYKFTIVLSIISHAKRMVLVLCSFSFAFSVAENVLSRSVRVICWFASIFSTSKRATRYKRAALMEMLIDSNKLLYKICRTMMITLSWVGGGRGHRYVNVRSNL